MNDACAKCGYPRREHAYSGACYGLCGKFVPPAPDSVTPATPSDQSGVPTVCDESLVAQTVENGGAEDSDMLRRYGASLPGDDHCHAAQDGECFWPKCPQERDGEPNKSGRHCPLDR